MELLQELFLTASLSLLLAFLFAKIVSVASSTSSSASSPDHSRKIFIIDEHVVLGGAPATAAAYAEEERGELILGGEGREAAEAGGFDWVEGGMGGEAEGGVGVVEERAMRVESVDDGGELDECVVNEVAGEGIRRVDVVLVDAGEDLAKSRVVEIEVVRSASDEGATDEGVPGRLGLGEFNAGSVGGEEKMGCEGGEELTAAQLAEAGEAVEEVGVESGEIGGEEAGAVSGWALHIEDDWEGIEKSELEKLFAVALAFVSSAAGAKALAKLGNEVQMQLYGLQKIATEGPCYETQPLALMVSARAKWHAWQKLGNMNQEVAMEQFIALLSDKIPGWIKEKPREAGFTSSEVGRDTPESLLEHDKLFVETERKLDLKG